MLMPFRSVVQWKGKEASTNYYPIVLKLTLGLAEKRADATATSYVQLLTLCDSATALCLDCICSVLQRFHTNLG